MAKLTKEMEYNELAKFLPLRLNTRYPGSFQGTHKIRYKELIKY